MSTGFKRLATKSTTAAKSVPSQEIEEPVQKKLRSTRGRARSEAPATPNSLNEVNFLALANTEASSSEIAEEFSKVLAVMTDGQSESGAGTEAL